MSEVAIFQELNVSCARSSVGQSNGFLIRRSQVRVLPGVFCKCRLPRWRNRQTRQVEGLVGLIPRAGSTPVLGILFLSPQLIFQTTLRFLVISQKQSAD